MLLALFLCPELSFHLRSFYPATIIKLYAVTRFWRLKFWFPTYASSIWVMPHAVRIQRTF